MRSTRKDKAARRWVRLFMRRFVPGLEQGEKLQWALVDGAGGTPAIPGAPAAAARGKGGADGCD